MTSVRERLTELVEQGGSYALSTTDLITFEEAIYSKHPGPGGSNLHQIYQFKASTGYDDPNGSIFVATTEPAICLDADNQRAWQKTDGVISNTGWVELSFPFIP